MSPDDIKALRKALTITQRELAEVLEVEVDLVRRWERDEAFPTKAHCTAMEKLRANPPVKAKTKALSPMQLLGDREFMTLVRKLMAHPALRAEVTRAAAGYTDPLDDGA